MKEPQFHQNVSFRLNNILEINHRSLESVDLTPDALAGIVASAEVDIALQMALLESYDEEFRPTSSRFLRPIILISRLALLDQQYNALTQKALISGQRHITHGSLLTEEAVAYWNSVNRDKYLPQVHVLEAGDRTSSGVWLGISPV